jgi:hypothetical protein
VSQELNVFDGIDDVGLVKGAVRSGIAALEQRARRALSVIDVHRVVDVRAAGHEFAVVLHVNIWRKFTVAVVVEGNRHEGGRQARVMKVGHFNVDLDLNHPARGPHADVRHRNRRRAIGDGARALARPRARSARPRPLGEKKDGQELARLTVFAGRSFRSCA